MSQILQLEVKPQQIKPQKLSEIIRTFDFPQIKGCLADNKGGYCVLGGLYKYFGYDFAGCDFGSGYSLSEEYRTAAREVAEFNIDGIVNMNNEGKSFSEIADYLEARGL